MRAKLWKKWKVILLILSSIFIAIFLGVLFLSPLKVILVEPSKTLSEEERLDGFIKLWDTVKNHFVYFDQVPALDWNEVLEEYEPKVRAAQTVAEYYNVLQEMTALLKDGHTKVWSPFFFNPFYRAIPPFQLKEIEGRTIITEVRKDDPDIQASGLQPGMEVLAINGKSIKDVLKEIMVYISASTPQALTFKSYQKLLMGYKGTYINLTVKDVQGNKRLVKLKRKVNFHEILCYLGIFCDLVESHCLKDNIGYIHIQNFITEGVVKEFDQAISKLMDTDGLILDLRGTLGGNSRYSLSVAGRLINKAVPGFKILINKTGKINESELPLVKTITPRGKPYLKPIVVLVDAGTVSATEDALLGLHYSKRVVIVGEATCGSTGQPIVIKLPCGGKALVCASVSAYPDGRPFVGVGIIPDVKVHPTIDGISSGKDEVLEKGIEIVKELIR